MGIQENALRLLKAFYEATGGNTEKRIRVSDLLPALGVSEEDGRAAMVYLDSKYLLKMGRELAKFPVTTITASGVDAIEGALAHPNERTRHFPPASNVINIGTMIGGAIQQANVSSTQAVNIGDLSQINLSQLASELGHLKAALLEQAKDGGHYAAIGQVVEAQQAAQRSDPAAVRKAFANLGGAARWVFGVATTIGAGLVVQILKSAIGL